MARGNQSLAMQARLAAFKDIAEEVAREKRHSDDKFIGEYSGEEFEDTFNQCLTSFIDSKDYWIRIF